MKPRTTLGAAAIAFAAILLSEPRALAAPTEPASPAPDDRPLPAEAASPAGPAPASPAPVVPTAALWGRTAVRVSFAAEILTDTVVEMEVSHRFATFAGLDVAIGQADLGYGHSGVAADLTGRLYLFTEGRGGLTFAAGPSVRSANEFGTVGFLRGEIAVEYRPRGGLSVLFGVGESTALNDSGQATCPDAGLFLGCFEWRDHIKKGDPSLNLRLAFGVSF
jgi:hypothetical protein